MITPRRTRLLRVPDLHAFRRAIQGLSREGEPGARLVVVPTRGAAAQLGAEGVHSPFVTLEQLYERLHARLPHQPRRLTAFERDALAQAAASDAAAAVPGLPFRVRPGLVAEILRFYDHLRRHSQQASRFEALLEQALGGDETGSDRGAARLLQQTRFLARTFAEYERRLAASGACDEHSLRQQLVLEPGRPAVAHVVVTTADWIADPDGLFVADFDLLARIPQLEGLDILCTEGVLKSGFHQRVHEWLPGIEEVDAAALFAIAPRAAPRLVVPPDGPADQPWFTCRDREEELIAIARRATDPGAPPPDRIAVVFKRPLPYLYLAPATLGAAGIPYQAGEGLPLAAEPTAAAIDLVLEVAQTGASRSALVALLRSPQFEFGPDQEPLTRESVSALDRALSDARYLGDVSRLEALAAAAGELESAARPALEAAVQCGRELAPLCEAAPASQQVRRLAAFVTRRWRPLDADTPWTAREARARGVITELFDRLAAAHAAHHDPVWTIDELAAAVRRWIGEQTFAPVASATGVHLVDDRAARYGDFDEVALVGLIEHEWPERPRRSIFYPPGLIKALGWPSERDRRAAADAQFLDLLALASSCSILSTVTLDDESIVVRSTQLDEVANARLITAPAAPGDPEPRFADEMLAKAPPLPHIPDASARGWADMRLGRPPADAPAFHGAVGTQPAKVWSVSALETYLACPFKFFAQHVLRLQEEPDDEEVMDPRRQGQFVHAVFEAFFDEWQRSGRRAIVPENLPEARAMFVLVVDRALARLPEGEAGLERTRLLGSAAAAGLGDAVLRMEAERPIAVAERLLEHRLEGDFVVATASGPRVVRLRGKADRLDLLEDGTFRLIDYKLGWPPDRNRALQLPIYGLLAEQRLADYRGRRWRFGEGAYLAFKGPRRVVPLFGSPAQRDEVLAAAQQRLADTLDAIGRGEFPPSPDDVFRCETCSYASVCRKDYV